MLELASSEKKRGGDIQRGRLVDPKPPGGDDDQSPALAPESPITGVVPPKQPQLAAAAWLQSEVLCQQ